MVDVPKENGAPAPSAAKTLGAAILAKGREYVVGVLITACIGGFAAGWYAFKGVVGTYTDNVVVNAVAADLAKTNSTLAVPIKNLFAHDHDFDVGELNSGHFVLTPTNPTYLLPIYFPQGSKGTLVVLLSGTISSRSYVALLSPDGGRNDIDITESIFPLKDVFDAPRPEGSLSSPRFRRERSQHFDDLRSLTFQLEGPDAVNPPPNSSPNIEVTYVTLISPTIKLDHH
jgi:hypothetical protein